MPSYATNGLWTDSAQIMAQKVHKSIGFCTACFLHLNGWVKAGLLDTVFDKAVPHLPTRSVGFSNLLFSVYPRYAQPLLRKLQSI
jgi:hypothetical protein